MAASTNAQKESAALKNKRKPLPISEMFNGLKNYKCFKEGNIDQAHSKPKLGHIYICVCLYDDLRTYRIISVRLR